MSLTVRAVMIAVLAAAVAAACDDAPAPQATSGASTPVPAKPAGKDAQIPPTMVSAVSASKTASLIGIHFALESAPAVGKPLTVNLAVVPHRDFAQLRVLFETPESVKLTSGGRFEAPSNVKAETMFSHKLVVEPREEGVYLISAAVDTESDEGSVIRIYSIPIIVYGAPGTPATPPDASQPDASAG